jgi:hypothetical protein
MSNRGQAQYLRIYEGATTYQRWQGYYVNSTVTWDSASWAYQPFAVNGLIGGTPGTDVGITIEAPATETILQAFKDAINFNRLVEVKLYQFDTRLTNAVPQAGQLLIGAYTGEAISMGGSFSLIELRLGSTLAPVGAQIPPRKYTNRLIGAPIRM